MSSTPPSIATVPAAACDLRELGFTRATDLDGGLRAWAAVGLPVSPEPTRYVS